MFLHYKQFIRRELRDVSVIRSWTININNFFYFTRGDALCLITSSWNRVEIERDADKILRDREKKSVGFE